MKPDRKTILQFILPGVVCIALLLLLPTLRAIYMSFFSMPQLTSPSNTWKFVGLDNYAELFQNKQFLISLANLAKILLGSWFITLFLALMLALSLHSIVKYRRIFATIIYLPQVISAVAMGYIWILFVYNNNFGLLKQVFSSLGLTSLAKFPWLKPDNILMAMIIAGIFAALGQFTIMFIAALNKIPKSCYEAARIEGASSVKQLTAITLPLISNEIRSTSIIFISNSIGYFVYPQIFQSINTSTPMVFTYTNLFANDLSTEVNVGIGTASAVIMLIMGFVIYYITNFLIKDNNYEY